jgi:plastocyanin
MKTTLGIAALAVASFALAAAAPRSAQPAAGTVKGKVTFDGKVPELEPLKITEEQAKGCCPAGRSVDTTDPSLIVSKEGAIANAVITIEVEGAKVEPMKAVHLDQKECRYEPHVMVVTTGTTVEFLNSDGIAHNVHTYATKNDSFNQTIAPGAKHEQKLEKSDRIEIKCDIHPWMNSWLVVVDTPYHAVTQADGSFEIAGLEPGEYEAELWHERLGKEKATVTVKPDGTADLVAFELGEKKKARRR